MSISHNGLKHFALLLAEADQNTRHAANGNIDMRRAWVAEQDAAGASSTTEAVETPRHHQAQSSWEGISVACLNSPYACYAANVGIGIRCGR